MPGTIVVLLPNECEAKMKDIANQKDNVII